MPALVIVLVVDTRAVVIVSVIDAGAVAIVFNVDAGAVVRGALIEGDAVAWDCVIARDTPPHLTEPTSHRQRRPSLAVRKLGHSVAFQDAGDATLAMFAVANVET
ncbi:hypothetical protein EDB85DRAFT_2147140 [Lactarius pseudohatsudake]|nr:hypothetical protein EDB85DRAFT_2147140 [Lactarius pseudohatsudake]